MEHKIILAGSGGQGIMLLGKVLAEAAMAAGKFVTYLPAYGAEVRGGTANCTVVIADTEIGSPFAEKADSLVIMNQPSLDRFLPRLKAGGTLVLNSTLAAAPVGGASTVCAFPFTDIAIGLGSVKVANMAALGCLASRTGLVAVDRIMAAVEKVTRSKPELAQINKRAVTAGTELR